MVDWNRVDYDDIVLLAGIAASHGMGISDLLHNLHLLTQDEREVVDQLLQKHAEGQTDRSPNTL